MEAYDTDHNGTLDFTEFRQLYLDKLLPMIEDYNSSQLEPEAEEADEGSEASEMVWQCDVCETPWDTLEEATACEERCNAKAAGAMP